MLKIAIVGAGAIGGSIAGILSEKGYDVTVIDKNQQHINAINTSGLLIDGLFGEKTYKHIKISNTLAGMYDVIFLAVKSIVTTKAVQEIKNNLASDGVLVSLQNGINNDLIVPEIGEGRFVAGVVGYGATNNGPGHISITSSERVFCIGGLGKSTPRLLPEVARILNEIGETHISDNILGEQWGKLAMNCIINPLCAIYNRTFGESIHDAKVRFEMQQILTEVITVGNAAGVKFNKLGGKVNIEKTFLIHVIHDVINIANKAPSPTEKILALLEYPLDLFKGSLVLQMIALRHGTIMSSMWQDLQMHQRTEIDFLNGYISKLGCQYHIATKANDHIVEKILELERIRGLR